MVRSTSCKFYGCLKCYYLVLYFCNVLIILILSTFIYFSHILFCVVNTKIVTLL